MIYFLLFSMFNMSSHQDVGSVSFTYNYVAESKYDNGYKEERYNEILEKVIEVYSPLIKDRNGTFHIMSDWSDGAVNMWAWRWGDEYWLEVPGGMARYYLINEEAFVLSMCHELGHLLGGTPGNQPISYEGQSDYFASLKCIKRVLPEIEPVKEVVVSAEVKKACSDIQHVDRKICERALEGAKSLSSYYAELEKVAKPLISTPSSSVQKDVLTVHPPAQCRLDTFYAGILCDRDINIALSFEDDSIGTCQLESLGARPRCWYP